MSRSGRKPLPTNVKKFRGTARRDRQRVSEPKPTGVATCPSWLDATAKAEWRRLSAELTQLGLLTSVDRAALVGYVVAWSDLRWASEHLKRNPRILKTPNGHQQPNPALTVRRQAAKQMLQFASEFGMTPSARTRTEGLISTAQVTKSAVAIDAEPVTDKLGRPI